MFVCLVVREDIGMELLVAHQLIQHVLLVSTGMELLVVLIFLHVHLEQNGMELLVVL